MSSPPSSSARATSDRRAPSAALLQGTVFCSGAVVMVVEIVGTRVLAPVFGAGLFVWAALLSVTLCSLAIGYYSGGAMIDRRPEAHTLGVALAGSAAALAVGVVGAPPLLSWGLAHGPRIGSLWTAAVLFGPALSGLGMIGPMAVRLATTDVGRTGHRVGGTYAVSTAGSLLGTLLVVFVLVPVIETNVLLLGASGLVALNAVLWLRGRARGAALVVLAGAALSGHSTSRALPPDLRVVERVQSPFGLLEVIEDSSRHVRLLRADHSILGGSQLDRDGAIFAYLHVLEALSFMRPQARDMLQIGLGTGALSMIMQRRGVAMDAVDIDPEVVRLAKAHFHYTPTGTVAVEDARAFLNRTTRKYDFVVHDTFTGGVTPAHLLSREVLEQIRGLLRPGGILAINFPGFASGPRADATHAVAATIRAVFPQVRIFRDSAQAAGTPAMTNMIFFASDRPMELYVPADTSFEDAACEHTLTHLEAWEVHGTHPQAPIITDARNPLARMQLASAEEHYEAMAKLLPAQAWIPW